jgi:hypothetical protein
MEQRIHTRKSQESERTGIMNGYGFRLSHVHRSYIEQEIKGDHEFIEDSEEAVLVGVAM